MCVPRWRHETIFNENQRDDFSGRLGEIGDSVVVPSRYPRSRDLLAASGYKVVSIDNSELAKAEGGLTCMSLLFEAR